MIPYILKTLQQEDHVFVERLGAFRTQLKHAVVEKNVIHPPYNEVVFSQDDSEENNFALANQISREKKCLFTEANEQIMRWVDELLSALQHNKSVTYEGFGTFMLDKKGNISFESAVVPQLNSQFEGMEPIDIKNVGVAVVEDDEPVKVVETVEEPEPEPVVESEPIAEPEPEYAETFQETSLQLEPESVVESEPVVANNDSPEDETVTIEEPVEEPEPEPVVEPEPIAEPEPEYAETFPETSQQPEPESVVDPEPVGANNDSPEDETMKGEEKDDEEDDEDDDEDDEEEDEEEEEEEDDDEKKHHKLAWLWILLLLLVALGALGFVFRDKITSLYHQWKDKEQSVEQDVTPEVTDDDNQTATFEDESVVDEVEAVEEVTPEVVEEPTPKPVAAAPVKSTSDGKYDYIQFEQGRFYVIVGSFPTESDVVKHIRNKRLGQYSPVIVKQEGVKNLRVCIGVFNTEAEAEQFGKSTNQNYWVLK
jgi:nucleoid DNA-binding protein